MMGRVHYPIDPDAINFDSLTDDETDARSLCHETLEHRWEITSHPHAKYLAELTGQTTYADTNLETLRKLGYGTESERNGSI